METTIIKVTNPLKHRALALGGMCLRLAGASAWQSDNGDGAFTNPPLYADYPDPDIIRAGANFYFVTTTFVNSPGLTLLRSRAW